MSLSLFFIFSPKGDAAFQPTCLFWKSLAETLFGPQALASALQCACLHQAVSYCCCHYFHSRNWIVVYVNSFQRNQENAIKIIQKPDLLMQRVWQYVLTFCCLLSCTRFLEKLCLKGFLSSLINNKTV